MIKVPGNGMRGFYLPVLAADIVILFPGWIYGGTKADQFIMAPMSTVYDGALVYISWVHWHQLLNGLRGLWKFVLAESLEIEHSLLSSVPGGDNNLNNRPYQGENGVPRADLEEKKDRLFDNLESIERWMDQLLARASLVKSKEDLAASERECEVVKKLFALAELDVKWVRDHIQGGD
ncbi:hypothetical protein TIFTF001_023901 [Ficus carica]|uniref:Uncharacterized protein n=1 Tax=Ficus carica TaxID=3494 RepID=A0AA88DFN3_FICCA|nr:hypothetical protein TIFTF001_023901 [Ficus carica]